MAPAHPIDGVREAAQVELHSHHRQVASSFQIAKAKDQKAARMPAVDPHQMEAAPVKPSCEHRETGCLMQAHCFFRLAPMTRGHEIEFD